MATYKGTIVHRIGDGKWIVAWRVNNKWLSNCYAGNKSGQLIARDSLDELAESGIACYANDASARRRAYDERDRNDAMPKIEIGSGRPAGRRRTSRRRKKKPAKRFMIDGPISEPAGLARAIAAIVRSQLQIAYPVSEHGPLVSSKLNKEINTAALSVQYELRTLRNRLLRMFKNEPEEELEKVRILARAADILGIPVTATVEEISTAYRRLAALHHPDHNGSTAKMAEINNARQIMLEHAKRRENRCQ
jgi:hypothetical protein